MEEEIEKKNENIIELRATKRAYEKLNEIING